MNHPYVAGLFRKKGFQAGFLLLFLVASLGLAGCKSNSYQNFEGGAAPRKTGGSLVIREGDTLNVTFPGAPNLNASQKIGRDGKVSLSLVGEVTAAGKTVSSLEKELLELYSDKLVTKVVIVSVQAAPYSVYVTGPGVLRPGKLTTEKSMTALEAVLEAGVDYSKANLKSVKVTRILNGQTVHFTLNLKREMEAENIQPFYLQPEDIVFVPEKFVWF